MMRTRGDERQHAAGPVVSGSLVQVGDPHWHGGSGHRSDECFGGLVMRGRVSRVDSREAQSAELTIALALYFENASTR